MSIRKVEANLSTAASAASVVSNLERKLNNSKGREAGQTNSTKAKIKLRFETGGKGKTDRNQRRDEACQASWAHEDHCWASAQIFRAEKRPIRNSTELGADTADLILDFADEVRVAREASDE